MEKNTKQKNVAVIFAGGVGQRMGVKDIPKQFLEVEGKPIIIYTIEYFQNHTDIDEIYLVCIKPWMDYMNFLIEKYNLTKVKAMVPGGKTGQDSIYLGLKAAKEYCDYNDVVLIHDGVRPFISLDLISRVINDTKKYGNAIASTGCNETFLVSKDGLNIDSVPIRKESYNGQAPQGFILGEILDAHEEMRKMNPNYENVIDSCTLYNMLGKKTYLTPGDRGNLKITNPVDVYVFEAWLKYKNNNEKVIGISDLSEYKLTKGMRKHE